MRLGGCGHTYSFNPHDSLIWVLASLLCSAGSWGYCLPLASWGDFRSCCPISTGHSLIWGIGRHPYEHQVLLGGAVKAFPPWEEEELGREPCLAQPLSPSLMGNRLPLLVLSV